MLFRSRDIRSLHFAKRERGPYPGSPISSVLICSAHSGSARIAATRASISCWATGSATGQRGEGGRHSSCSPAATASMMARVALGRSAPHLDPEKVERGSVATRGCEAIQAKAQRRRRRARVRLRQSSPMSIGRCSRGDTGFQRLKKKIGAQASRPSVELSAVVAPWHRRQ